VSVQSLKSEVEGRGGRELLPISFPIELLIGITRKLALVADSALPQDELQTLAVMVRDYLGRVLGMQGAARRRDFDARANELTASLTQELYDCMCEEIVSRFIEYDVRSLSLQDRLLGVLDGTAEPL
jgi:hypothetical protein